MMSLVTFSYKIRAEAESDDCAWHSKLYFFFLFTGLCSQSQIPVILLQSNSQHESADAVMALGAIFS